MGRRGLSCSRVTFKPWLLLSPRLLNDANRRTELGKAGRRFVEEELSVGATVQGYVQILEGSAGISRGAHRGD